MTITQIQAFLETARCKNISEAAKRLYITQPALGRQLTAIERELNMQLMIRTNRGIRLTPAGAALAEELEQAMNHVNAGITKAQQASRGYVGDLTIAVLEELDITDEIHEMIGYFEEHHPNISIRIQRRSYRGLLDGLYDGSLDASFSLSVGFIGAKGLDIYHIRPSQPAFAVPVNHPLAQKEELHFSDFRGVPQAIVDMNDCPEGVRFVQDTFYKFAGFYPEFFFTTTQKDAMTWVESGKKCAVLNMDMTVAKSKYVKMFPFYVDEDGFYIEMGSRPDNENQGLQLLKEYFRDVYQAPKKDGCLV